MEKTISIHVVTTLTEMMEALSEILVEAGVAASDSDSRPTAETIYTSINSDCVRLSLVEETLLDGSKVYNVILSRGY